jgi:hypothetical protein
VPGRDEAYFLTATRHRLFAPPNLPAADATRFADETERPVHTTVS